MQDVNRQPPIVSTGFHKLKPFVRQGRKPIGELEREQFTKQRPDAYAGIEIATSSEVVIFLFIISTIGTIEREFHEARERNHAPLRDFRLNSLDNTLQLFAGFVAGADLAK